jgi:predicted transcriptional regulator
MMIGPSGDSNGTEPAFSWRALRASLLFLVDSVDIAREGRGVLDALILSTISSATVARITQDDELELAFAGLDTAPPEPLRRPISINALAQSLGVPFETVRRRVKALAAGGECELSRGGVLQPQEAVLTETYFDQAWRRYLCTRQLYFDLRPMGQTPPTPADAPRLTVHPVRIVNRAVALWGLRAVEPLNAIAGSPLDACLLLHVAKLDSSHIPLSAFPNDRPLACAERRGVSAQALARSAGMPAETVRRRLLGLIEKGLVERRSDGVVLAAGGLEPTQPPPAAVSSARDLHRMWVRLGQLGVTAWWLTQEGAATAPPRP